MSVSRGREIAEEENHTAGNLPPVYDRLARLQLIILTLPKLRESRNYCSACVQSNARRDPFRPPVVACHEDICTQRNSRDVATAVLVIYDDLSMFIHRVRNGSRSIITF
jgi:hypothetical protein